MNDEPTTTTTDEPNVGPPTTDREPAADRGDEPSGASGPRDFGTIVTAVGEAVQEIARDVAERAGPAVRDAATKAGPVVREATAKAADVAAKAAEAAGPIAQKIAAATEDVGHRVAERGRELATDLRRSGNGHGPGAGAESTEPGIPPTGTPPVEPAPVEPAAAHDTDEGASSD